MSAILLMTMDLLNFPKYFTGQQWVEMVAGDGLADVLVISDGKVSASVHRRVQILGDGELVARLESDLAEHILIVGIDANRGFVDLPLGVAAYSAAADDGVVARLIEGVAIVGVQ